jgi:flagellar motor switch/type III secretory pathway protein FliN
MEIAANPDTAAEVADVAHAADTQFPPHSREPVAEPAETASTELVPALPSQLISPLGENYSDADQPPLPDHLRQIPFRLELRVPLSRFTLRDLQQLSAGSLLLTEHLSVRDLVLTAAGERLLLVELEAVEQQLAARVKRLAWRHKWRRKS